MRCGPCCASWRAGVPRSVTCPPAGPAWPTGPRASAFRIRGATWPSSDDEAALPFEGDDTWSLLLHWSAKETLFKCLDAEGVDFRRHLRIIPFRPARRGVFHAREYRTGERRRFFVRYLLHPGFVLTWAAE